MSSTFYVVCLSHDPALVSSEYSRAEGAEAAVKDGSSGHTDCDRMIVRVSGGPIEVGCPGHGLPGEARRRHGCPSLHRDTEWIGVGWLHVLAHARLAGALPDLVARHHDLRCWTEQRLWRLREELGLELPQRVDESGGEPGDVVHLDVSAQASTPPQVDEETPSAAAQSSAAFPAWRQNPDGSRTLPFYGGTLTASAEVHSRCLEMLLLLLAGPALRGGV